MYVGVALRPPPVAEKGSKALSEITSKSENSHNQAVANSKSDVDGSKVEAIAETQPTTAEAEATADDNGMSTGQIVVLSIIGGLIVIGGGTVGVMAVKKKKK